MLAAEFFLAFLLAICCAMCARIVSHHLGDLRTAQATEEARLFQYVTGGRS